MAIARNLTFLFLAAVAAVLINLMGIAFLEPVRLSFEVRTDSAFDTVISYRAARESFTEKLSRLYTAVPGEGFGRASLSLGGTDSVDAIRFELDGASGKRGCFRNFRLTGRSGEREIPLGALTLENIPEGARDAGSGELCVAMTGGAGAVPAFTAGSLAEQSFVDKASRWQFLYLASVFCLLSLLWTAAAVVGARKYREASPADVVMFLIFAGIAGFAALFAVDDFLLGRTVDTLRIGLAMSGCIVAYLLVPLYGFFAKHKTLCFALLLLPLMALTRWCVFRSVAVIAYPDALSGFLHVAKQDFPFYALIALLAANGAAARSFLVKIPLLLAAALCALPLLTDYVLITERSERLILAAIDFSAPDPAALGAAPHALIHYFHTGQGLMTALAVLCFLVLAAPGFFVRRKTGLTPAGLVASAALLAAAGGVYYADRGTGSVYDSRFCNVIEASRGMENLDFSRVSVSSTSEVIRRKAGLGRRCNVVLLVADSLSSFASKLYEGHLDLTPRLDRIASENIWFKNSFAAGYDSAAANYALLTGRPYLHDGSDLADPALYERTVVKDFVKAGYDAVLVYSSAPSPAERVQYDNAGFTAQFDYMNSVYPSTVHRYDYGALDDKTLLKTAARNIGFWTEEKNGAAGHFVAILTSSGRSPYVVPVEMRKNPKRPEYDFETVTRFTDEAIGEFVADLEAMNYFANGILVITGNHRAPHALSKSERDVYGDIGIARVPLIIVDRQQMPRAFENDVSAVSVGEIMEYLALGEYDSSSFKVNPFVEDRNQVIVYQRQFPRNTVLLKNGDTSGEFLIDGNSSGITGSLRDGETISGDLLAALSRGGASGGAAAKE